MVGSECLLLNVFDELLDLKSGLLARLIRHYRSDVPTNQYQLAMLVRVDSQKIPEGRDRGGSRFGVGSPSSFEIAQNTMEYTTVNILTFPPCAAKTSSEAAARACTCWLLPLLFWHYKSVVEAAISKWRQPWPVSSS